MASPRPALPITLLAVLASLCSAVGYQGLKLGGMMPSAVRNNLHPLAFAAMDGAGDCHVPPALDDDAEADCAVLANRGSFYSVRLSIGVPPQEFDVVADTGSGSLIVPLCICQENGGCALGTGQCFNINTSSPTFQVPYDDAGAVGLLDISYGSGRVQAILVTDVVRLAQREQNMESGVGLIIQEDSEIIALDMEGILGLGRPFPDQRNFMLEAGISRFEMCFTDSAGFLRLDPPVRPDTIALGTISDEFWALDLAGISIGAADSPTRRLSVCKPRDAVAGELAADSGLCSAIPDSGTTLIVAPAEHVLELKDSLCDSWPLCREEHATLDADLREMIEALGTTSRAAVFSLLLTLCNESNVDDILNDLPPLNFHLVGDGGVPLTLSLPPSSYIFGNGSNCELAFEGMTLNGTSLEGDVWILGMPIFFDYHIAYGVTSEPPSMSFAHVGAASPCTACGAQPIAMNASRLGLLQTGASIVKDSNKRSRKPRKITTPPRVGPRFKAGSKREQRSWKPTASKLLRAATVELKHGRLRRST